MVNLSRIKKRMRRIYRVSASIGIVAFITTITAVVIDGFDVTKLLLLPIMIGAVAFAYPYYFCTILLFPKIDKFIVEEQTNISLDSFEMTTTFQKTPDKDLNDYLESFFSWRPLVLFTSPIAVLSIVLGILYLFFCGALMFWNYLHEGI